MNHQDKIVEEIVFWKSLLIAAIMLFNHVWETSQMFPVPTNKSMKRLKIVP